MFGERQMAEKLVYALDELPFGRTKAYEEHAAGRLTLRKLGGRTVVLADELKAYLDALPKASFKPKPNPESAVA
jgi:hypothetical protein